MATLFQLRNEGPWWDAETMSPTMQKLAERLRVFYGVGPANIGAKGDTAPGHMQGAHRSRAWIKNSAYCTNRLYTVSETQGNRTGGDDNWLAGMDITIPSAQLIPMCQRLDVAVRAGALEKVTEWYGNDDGDSRVDGYNNIRNVVASSDLSHLWHLHLTFDRGLAGEDHTDLYQILTGSAPAPTTVEDDPMHMTTVPDSTVYAIYPDRVVGGKVTAVPMSNVKGRVDAWRGAGIRNVASPGPLDPNLFHILPLDAFPAPSGGGGGLTYEQTVQAAKEGANLAEDS